MATHSASDSAPREARLSPAAHGAAFAFLATVVWSFNFIAGRGFAEAIPPATLAFFRWLIAFAAVLPFAWPDIRREWRHYAANRGYYLAAGLIGIGYFNTALYVAAHSSPALNISLIATTAPLFTLILARILFGEPISRMRALGIAVVLSGIVLLIARGDLGSLASLSFHGSDLLVLSAALSFSIYTLLLRKKPAGGTQRAYLAVTFGVGLVSLAPCAAWELLRGGAIHFSPGLAGGLLYMGLGASLFSFACWARAVDAIGPARASVIYYSMPLFCGVEAVLFLGEPVLWVHFASGAMILGGLVLATR